MEFVAKENVRKPRKTYQAPFRPSENPYGVTQTRTRDPQLREASVYPLAPRDKPRTLLVDNEIEIECHFGLDKPTSNGKHIRDARANRYYASEQ